MISRTLGAVLGHTNISRGWVTRVTTEITAQYTTLPCDWLEAFDVRLENGPELIYQPRGQLANIWWARTVQAPEPGDDASYDAVTYVRFCAATAPRNRS